MKLKLSDGSLIEIIDNDEGASLYSNPGDVVHELDSALDPIIKFSEDTLKKFAAGTKPDELEIFFGVEAGGEGGIMGLAKAHGKATISVTLKWSGK